MTLEKPDQTFMLFEQCVKRRNNRLLGTHTCPLGFAPFAGLPSAGEQSG
jgi:hypothetical protein